jgi:hypothetical protein
MPKLRHPPVQNLVGIRQLCLAMHTLGHLGRHRRIGITGQPSAAALATETARTWLAAGSPLASIRLLSFGRWQARIARCLRWLPQPGFELGDQTLCSLELSLRGLKAGPQRKYQRVLLGLTFS